MAEQETQAVVKAAPKNLTASERFMNMVIAEFSEGVDKLDLAESQKRLAQNYFIAIDAAINTAETKRQAKKRDKDPLPVIWENIDMRSLARNVVTHARMSLDPALPNQISMVPFKDGALNKYKVGFIKGYRGLEVVAKKYGLDIPDDVVVELVYDTDKFKSIKKDANHPYDTYEFEITDDFNRGKIKGGFNYHVYSQAPEKNKIAVLTLKDILKRKPRYASVEFWGGEKDVWKDGQKVGTESTEGWYEKMCYKTVFRAAYNDITADSQKIDDNYMRLKQAELEFAEVEIEAEIIENANMECIDVEVEDINEPEALPEPAPEQKQSKETKPEGTKEQPEQVTMDNTTQKKNRGF